MGLDLTPSFECLDSRFRKLALPYVHAEKLYTGCRWSEGPAWLAAGRYLVWSDIPNDRMMRWDETDGSVSVFRQPAMNTNGHTVDLQGRLVSCEHRSRCVSRTEFDGTRKVLADRYEGKRFNSPNDVVVKSDGTIWFTDPPYGLPRGQQRELDKNYIFRLDPRDGKLAIMTGAVEGPNGLAFSPDEKRLYVADNGGPKNIHIFDVIDGNSLRDAGILGKVDAGTPDGIRTDELGNVWSSQTGGIIIFS